MCLVLDPDTAFSDRPTLFAYGNVVGSNKLDPASAVSTCHRHTTCEVQWEAASPSEAAETFYGGLIRPFADVVCFYGGDVEQVAGDMLPWLGEHGAAVPQPRLLLIMAAGGQRAAATAQAQLLETLGRRLTGPERDLSSFVSVCVQRGSTQAAVIDRIRAEAHAAQQARVKDNSILNAVHLDNLFRRACDHFVNTKKAPFDMLGASRSHTVDLYR